MDLTEVLEKYFSEDETAKIACAIRSGLPIIIDGTQDPTGKTTLCKELCELGFDAVESWKTQKEESNNNAANIVITLNKVLKQSR